MTTANDLRTLYEEELGDLWSANDQMQRIVETMAEKASDASVKELLQKSVRRIAEHTAAVRSLVESFRGRPDPSRGMQGLMEEARKHALDTPLEPELRDLVILAEYQRMSHYGVAGFGTAAAYASVLGRKDEAEKLKSIVEDIYRGDSIASQLAVSAERAVKG